MEITRHDATCMIKQANSSKEVEAEVASFVDKDRITVVLNKSIKLSMIWNGKLYEGRAAGMDFTSHGPKTTTTTTGIRG